MVGIRVIRGKGEFSEKDFRREVFFCILLVIGGVLLGTVVSEFGLRAYHAVRDGNSKYCVWPPKMQKVFQPTPGTMPGVSGPTRFLVNSDGIRGDELTQERSYRILAIGGSTDPMPLPGPGKIVALRASEETQMACKGRRHGWETQGSRA